MEQEQFVFVGCVHETSELLLKRLEALITNPPQYLIFCGDVTGSAKLEKFKRLFYNFVYNRARNELGIGTDHEQKMSDDELLDYMGSAPEPGCNLFLGYRALMSFVYELEGDAHDVALARVSRLLYSDIATGIRNIARNFEYFGPWVKTLSESVRRGVVETIKDDAEKLARAVKPLQDAGTQILLVCGNWDNVQSTRDGMVGPGIEVFDTLPFFREKGWMVYDTIQVFETKHAVLVAVPYWTLLEPASIRDEHLANVLHSVEAGRAKGKTVLVVGHNEPNWVIHNLRAQNSLQPLTGIRAACLENFDHIIETVHPDEVIYPHQHNLLVDNDGAPVGLNAKYLLKVTGGQVALVTDPKEMGNAHQCVSSYIPFQRFGTLALTNDNDQRPLILGGHRQPVFVF